MNAKSVKLTVVSMAVGFGLVVLPRPGIQAQDKAAAPETSTNWVGNLVFGKKETGDPIGGRGPFPHADGQIEIGLRSDGVLVWRKAK